MNSVDPSDQVPPDPYGSARSVDVLPRELSKSKSGLPDHKSFHVPEPACWCDVGVCTLR